MVRTEVISNEIDNLTKQSGINNYNKCETMIRILIKNSAGPLHFPGRDQRQHRVQPVLSVLVPDDLQPMFLLGYLGQKEFPVEQFNSVLQSLSTQFNH